MSLVLYLHRQNFPNNFVLFLTFFIPWKQLTFLRIYNIFELLHIFLIFLHLKFFYKSETVSTFFNCHYFFLKERNLLLKLSVIWLLFLNFWIIVGNFILNTMILKFFDVLIYFSNFLFIKVYNLFILLQFIFIIYNSIIFGVFPLVDFMDLFLDHLVLFHHTLVFVAKLNILISDLCLICMPSSHFKLDGFILQPIILPWSLNSLNL